jgi:hypothetical protein
LFPQLFYGIGCIVIVVVIAIVALGLMQAHQQVCASLALMLGHQISKTLQSLGVTQVARWKIGVSGQVHDGFHADHHATSKAAMPTPMAMAVK